MRVYNIAQGSLEETRYWFILGRDLGYFDSSRLIEAADEVGRMLHGSMSGLGRGE